MSGFGGAAEDQVAIRALIDSYSDAVFRRDATDWGATWAEDALWNLMGTEVRGRAAIVGLWNQAMAGFPFVAFFAQVGSISIDGDRATGRIYTHEYLELADGSVSRPIGQYHDVYTRTADGWRFAERHFSILKETQAQ
ncbi:nuclear transport factor 2 family protein [Blastomonas sp. SL216]|uniref:nuclear transport factor 2 family protein n=1 Tax=Blastomonas sp. SL216 TaxID=2995169 RepID=UPI0023772A76|nr:nuclear transport factor 2 family protein [Blastomonas sp. SL216]